MLLDGIDMAKLKRVPRYERPAQSAVKHAETIVAYATCRGSRWSNPLGQSLSIELDGLPSDKGSLQLMVRALLEERDEEKRLAEEQKKLAAVQQQRAETHSRQAAELQVELLRVKLELERYKKWYYGPRADLLQSDKDLMQMLLNFAEELDCKPVPAEDLAVATESVESCVA